MLLGVDQRDEEVRLGLPTRSDSIIVVSIDPVSKTAAMISFPRDLWLTVPGFGEHRINEAYTLGELYRADAGGGPGMTARTLDLNFGLQVPYYATVNFRGFETIIDTLDGVIIDVPRPVKDDAYPTADYGIERLYVALGPQLMDGAQALKYARTRHTDNDLNRSARQQQVLLAIRDRALRSDTFLRLPTLVDQGMRTVKTNFTATQLLALGKIASQMDTSSLQTLVITYPMVVDFRGPAGAAILLPRKDDIRAAIRRTLEASAAPAAPAAP
jgi:LCP family protein required for cell wall assembly